MPNSVRHFETRRQLFPRGTCLIGTVGACQVLSRADHCVDRLVLGGSLAFLSASDAFCEHIGGRAGRKSFRHGSSGRGQEWSRSGSASRTASLRGPSSRCYCTSAICSASPAWAWWSNNDLDSDSDTRFQPKRNAQHSVVKGNRSDISKYRQVIPKPAALADSVGNFPPSDPAAGIRCGIFGHRVLFVCCGGAALQPREVLSRIQRTGRAT